MGVQRTAAWAFGQPTRHLGATGSQVRSPRAPPRARAGARGDRHPDDPGRAAPPAASRAPCRPTHCWRCRAAPATAPRPRGSSRQATVVEEDAPKAEAPYLQWSKDDVRPIQRELRRLRLYNLGIDGVLGKGSDQGLVEAFGGDEWRTLDAATVLQRLTSAERPKGGKGHDVRYGELFKDGLLDLTFGYGFMEELDEAGWAQYAKDIEDALAARGYSEDAGRAAELYKAAERGTNGFGRFFVKESALTYTPPAGAAAQHPGDRPLHHEPERREGRGGAPGLRGGHGAGRRGVLLRPRALRVGPGLRPQLRVVHPQGGGRHRRAGDRGLRGARQGAGQGGRRRRVGAVPQALERGPAGGRLLERRQPAAEREEPASRASSAASSSSGRWTRRARRR